MKPVWIVDDDQAIRWVLEKALSRAGITTRSFVGASDVSIALESELPAALISDIRMPGSDGFTLLKHVKNKYPSLPVIIMTAYSDLDSTVTAFQGGAFDYLAKPFDINEAVALILRAVREPSPNESTNHSSASEVSESKATTPSDKGILTQSSSVAMQEVFRAIGRLAHSNVTVLITGESGTGKELVARALHSHGVRSKGPFVALNTAAIPRDLLEAELFGHERGAFTGANALRRGRFEEASGGTLFLDEIGDMPFELQTRLLRVLSDGTFYRVGGAQPVSVDVRIVAATHQPLEERVSEGKCREDLFHRLNVIRLRLPPLRERREDIPELARHFLSLCARGVGVPVKRISEQAIQILAQFDFPGNVRQLENFCHWLTVMAPGHIVEVSDLPAEVRAADLPLNNPQQIAPASHQTWQQLLALEATSRLSRSDPEVWAALTKQFERTILHSSLEVCRGRRVEAAARLGMGRNTITRKLRELGMDSGYVESSSESVN